MFFCFFFLVVHFHLFHFCDLTHPCGMFSFLREKEKENWFVARAKSEVLQNTQQDAQCWGFELPELENMELVVLGIRFLQNFSGT